MSNIVSIHSFRGGTGKSNITASVAMLVAQAGHRVGIVDTDVQSPGIHGHQQVSRAVFTLGSQALYELIGIGIDHLDLDASSLREQCVDFCINSIMTMGIYVERLRGCYWPRQCHHGNDKKRHDKAVRG